ncbi:MAG: DUF1846 domain-containing protein [Endomicrobia bacterium]|nr:DUF1846 domain-containing protein [Endomicrobiia bacterium]MCL2506436.1 DUF1846 domain-containing protein [Endomicrobiia bacterium]
MKISFDNSSYMEKQTEEILKRVEQFNHKLYLEFGGKLFDDSHAARVLPGFNVNGKILLLEKLKEKTEIIICINAADIEKNKIRADLGITYDMDVLRLIDSVRKMGLYISSIVISQYKNQPSADMFKNKLERRGEKVYIHKPIIDYPMNIDLVVSDKGYGSNPYIETTRPLVVVTAPGSGSGKMATCLSQIYHEHKRNINAGYAKFETFPIWNLPLKHPVNLAYEAATADLNDVNAIDPFHLEAYGETAVNYNRDIEVFPIVKNILTKIMGTDKIYQSPTDMGVNMAGYCITDDEAVREAAKQEVVRRYFKTWCYYKEGRLGIEAVEKVEIIMKQLEIFPEYGLAVVPALEKSKQNNCPAMALVLPNGNVITGKTTSVLAASSNLVLNCIKNLAGIPDDIHLISPTVLEPMLMLKEKILYDKNPLLSLEEVLNALSICAATNPLAEKGLSKLQNLRGCDAHSSHMLSKADEDALKKLGINVTCTPEFPSDNLYYI